MKKVFAIGLLSAFLFNLGGYYVFFWVLKVQANKELSIKLDEGQYSEHETFEIKIPLSLPYPLQTSDYQRKSGHFVYKQEHYQLVKQKYHNDTLTIVAIKDVQSNQLTDVMDSFSETSGSQPLKDGSLNIPAKILSEYISSISISISCSDGWSRDITQSLYYEFIFNIDLSRKSPPPKV